MVSGSGSRLKKSIGRRFGYALGICIILAACSAGAFVFAKPSLLSFVNDEVKKYNIEVESSDINILGKVSLKNVRIPMNDGSKVTVDRLSGGLLVPWLGGTVSLYGIFLKKGDISVAIPELHLKSISRAAKDPAISSRTMQLLMQINASWIKAPEIKLTVDKDGKSGKVVIRRFSLDGLKRGKIDRVTIGGVSFALAFMSSSRKQSDIQTGVLSVRNIDIASAYDFLRGIGAEKAIVGPVALHNLKIDLTDGKGEDLHVVVGALRSSGLSLSPAKIPPLEAIQVFLAAWYASDLPDEHKRAALHDLRYVLESIAAIDVELKNATIENSELKTGFSYFEVKFRNWGQLIPEGLIISLQDFTLDMTRMQNEYVQFLREIGYEKLDLSLAGDVLWNPADHTMALRNIAFSGKDIGEISFQGTLLDFDKGFFSGDPSRMLAAIDGSAVSELDIILADKGIIDHFIEWETTQINISKQELKDSVYEIAVKSPPLLLKNYKDTQKIADAFGAFVRDSSTLHVRMVAREKKGVSLTDFIMIQNDLSVLFNQIDLDIRTEGQIVKAAGMN